MATRAFRTDESLKAEEITRARIPDFLADIGFVDITDERKQIGTSVSQTIGAISPDGHRLKMRIKICWRKRKAELAYSAAQLIAKIRTDDWEGEIQAFVNRARREGVTHFLFVQRVEDEITEAALVPAQELLPIWCKQRDVSEMLIREGMLGRKKKNHAMNGSSPTVYVADDGAPAVTDVLWGNPNVENLIRHHFQPGENLDDTYWDFDAVNVHLLGNDASQRLDGHRSFVKRDPRVRLKVLERARGRCEKCRISQSFLGFFDVHHILGVEKSDRVWNCVAICPNCHREAHFAPNREEINSLLLTWATQFK